MISVRVTPCIMRNPFGGAKQHYEVRSIGDVRNHAGIALVPVMRLSFLCWTVPLILVSVAPAAAHGPLDRAERTITFEDITERSGIDYRRRPSSRYDVIRDYQLNGFAAAEMASSPLKARGAPGVALFDYDRDGDVDIYVTNGPGTPNSLYQNQFVQTGRVTFVDVAGSAGVAATASDGTGTCYGDLDNDGDHDLLVLGYNGPHSLFENQGDGTFSDVSASSLITWAPGAMSCAMGDIDGDGRLDIAIANISSLDNVFAFFVDPFVYNVHNQLFRNVGSHQFHDVSATSGILDSDGVPLGAATMTWAVAILDLDLDGDQDIVFVDDQAGLPNTTQGGVDRGFLQMMENDGTGHFTARTISKTGEWMGIAVADLDCDGHLDVFGANFGDYGLTPMNPAYQLGDSTSRWYLGSSRGTFSDPGVGSLVATPFGWGASSLDFDNDGDADLLFHGGMDLITAVDRSNAGALLENTGCSARFIRNTTAFAGSVDHGRRTVQGVATGDLNLDGFVDVVSVSSVDIPAGAPTFSYPAQYGSPFDADGLYVPLFAPVGDRFEWTGVSLDDGTLSVEINSGGNGNDGVSIDVMGGIGLVGGGCVNRDGIGAVVTFTPRGGQPSMRPILGGSSYASQDSLTAHFGLGSGRRGTVEVLWPGGVKNRLYGVRAGEHVVMPEIPCSFDDPDTSWRSYRRCVRRSIRDLVGHGVVDRRQGRQLTRSAWRAFWDRARY